MRKKIDDNEVQANYDLGLKTKGCEIGAIDYSRQATLMDIEVFEAFARALETLSPSEIIKRLEV